MSTVSFLLVASVDVPDSDDQTESDVVGYAKGVLGEYRHLVNSSGDGVKLYHTNILDMPAGFDARTGVLVEKA